jgi:hypothetical protein
MGSSSFRQLWACSLAPAILTQEEQVQLEQERLEQAQLEQAQLEQAQLECAGSTPLSCASAYPEAPKALSDHMRPLARRGTQGSTDARFS